jgi:hypothetical protein
LGYDEYIGMPVGRGVIPIMKDYLENEVLLRKYVLVKG